jgi:hypothetical protein
VEVTIFNSGGMELTESRGRQTPGRMLCGLLWMQDLQVKSSFEMIVFQVMFTIFSGGKVSCPTFAITPEATKPSAD